MRLLGNLKFLGNIRQILASWKGVVPGERRRRRTLDSSAAKAAAKKKAQFVLLLGKGGGILMTPPHSPFPPLLLHNDIGKVLSIRGEGEREDRG